MNELLVEKTSNDESRANFVMLAVPWSTRTNHCYYQADGSQGNPVAFIRIGDCSLTLHSAYEMLYRKQLATIERYSEDAYYSEMEDCLAIMHAENHAGATLDIETSMIRDWLSGYPYEIETILMNGDTFKIFVHMPHMIEPPSKGVITLRRYKYTGEHK